MKKSSKVIIASVIALSISGGVFAYGKHGNWHMDAAEKAEFISERITKKLDLNETQQQNLKLLADDMVVIMQDMKAAREGQIKQVQSLLNAPVLDQSAALQMIQSKTQKINDRAPATIASLATFLDSLSVEQKDQLQAFADKRMHHRRDH